MFYPVALSASALSGSWPIADAPHSYPAVNVCCWITQGLMHPHSLLSLPPSPLASVVLDVPPPCSSWKDYPHGLSRNSPHRGQSLTLPNPRLLSLSTIRASARTLVVSSLTAAYPNPALSFVQNCHRIASPALWKLRPPSFIAAIHPPRRRTNFETPKQNA